MTADEWHWRAWHGERAHCDVHAIYGPGDATSGLFDC